MPVDSLCSVKEPSKHIPVAYDVGVAVVGGGVSGVFAALASARFGASTVIIDRFGSLGGNIGPGMCPPGAGLFSTPPKEGVPKEYIYGGTTGIPREFAERYRDLGGGASPLRKIHHLRDPNIASYVVMKMMKETGVELMLSTYAADPIMVADTVCGVFVENKSGRQAVKAGVVIDATGEADVARRAGIPVLHPKASYFKLDGHAPSGVGMWAFAGGVDWNRYDTYVKGHKESSKDDITWSKENLIWTYPPHILPYLRKAWESGEYRALKDIDGLAKVRSWEPKIRYDEEGIAGYKIQLDRPHGDVNVADGLHISKLEVGVRSFIFETVQFWKHYVPGFENAYLLCVAPFLGNRGGPCIEGEYVLTTDDCRAGRRFDDVIYMYGEARALRHTFKEEGKCKWTDVPYRVMVPKRLDGLLAVGRSASCIPDTLLRNRVAVMHMGQAGGMAAAWAVESEVSPRALDVKELQKRLLEAGFYLGDGDRLSELGLA